MTGPAGQLGQGLLDDAQALADLLHAHEVAVVAVADGADGHVEVVLLVARVGMVLAHVVGDAGAAQARAHPAVGQRVFLAEHAPTSLKRFAKMLLRVRSLSTWSVTSLHARDRASRQRASKSSGTSCGQAADAHVGDGEARAAAGLEEVVDVLARAEHHEERA